MLRLNCSLTVIVFLETRVKTTGRGDLGCSGVLQSNMFGVGVNCNRTVIVVLETG